MKQRNLLVARMLENFEDLASEYDEVTDTEVREAIHLTLNKYFVWGESGPMPTTFGLFSKYADEQVSAIIGSFLKSAPAEYEDVPIGKERLEVLQDPEVVTTQGHRYDYFLGHVDDPLPPDPFPDYFFEAGDYEDDADPSPPDPS